MKKILFALLATAVMAMAESHTHDGFFLNMALGFGHQNFEYEGSSLQYGTKGLKLESSGLSSEFDLKLGGSLSNSIVLHATIIGIGTASDIKAKRDGLPAYSNRNYTVGLSMLGIGMTYYLPVNVFFSGSIGLSQFTLDEDDSNSSTNSTTVKGASDDGLGVQFAIGKEWWVSDNWGLGVSAGLLYSAAADQHDAGDMSMLAVNIMFSATFN